ncbi:uncharacterized protein LOC124885753 [Capsicum annuum]|uniref:uncharacterized protein LOC124885753 n=1 Tax=Capsicum annuum TaxID=4072 RepID=UPI001FB08375|nr:uncharacterized protein LOC124885753 [Capsicum annuum]
MKHAVLNVSGKIWAFMEENVECSIVKDEEQQLTLKVSNQNAGISLLFTLVYAKCNANKSLLLWDSLTDLSDSYQLPWLVGGDFNVTRSEEEKVGDLPVTFNETQEFNQWISLCNMEEIQFKGSKFTWWNGRTDEDCIFKRIKGILPQLISPEQGGFVQGRSIAENVLVFQEIILEIRKRGKPPNMVLKLDMMKAYDRVEWLFLTKIYKRVEQGDPLSPTLFIIEAEVLSRSLKRLIQKKEFKLFGMPRGSPKLNHLAFPDDMIIL